MSALMMVLLLFRAAQSSVCHEPARVGAADSLTMRLRLTVQVRTPDGQPASHITVRFLDTAPPVRARDEGMVLGTTDQNGTLSAFVVHTWPDYYDPNRRPDSGTFDIIISSTLVRHAAVECIPREGDEWRLTLEAVMQSETIILSGSGERRAGPRNG